MMPFRRKVPMEATKRLFRQTLSREIRDAILILMLHFLP